MINAISEEMPEVYRDELKTILKHIKNRKTPGKTEIKSEML